jgi:hypothetical protein
MAMLVEATLGAAVWSAAVVSAQAAQCQRAMESAEAGTREWGSQPSRLSLVVGGRVIALLQVAIAVLWRATAL